MSFPSCLYSDVLLGTSGSCVCLSLLAMGLDVALLYLLPFPYLFVFLWGPCPSCPIFLGVPCAFYSVVLCRCSGIVLSLCPRLLEVFVEPFGYFWGFSSHGCSFAFGQFVICCLDLPG